MNLLLLPRGTWPDPPVGSGATVSAGTVTGNVGASVGSVSASATTVGTRSTLTVTTNPGGRS